MRPNLAVNIGGLVLPNPVLVASGTFGFATEYASFLDIDRLGGVVLKGTTLQPREGNPPPRLVETPAGLLNAIGLANPGVEVLIREKLPLLASLACPVVVNIAGETPAEFGRLAQRLSGVPGVAALEVNVSCPNVARGGMQFGTDPESTADVVRAVRASTALPVIVKLSPNVTSIVAVAQAAQAAGADALSLINTLWGMAIDIERQKPVLGNVTGGLSGPAVKPVALRCLWQVYEAVEVPLIGMGGILTAADALEFILAGASAVALGTANFIDPGAALAVLAGIESYLLERDIEDLSELVGRAHR
ncbi:MAG TPA: dihydroorotate dehydrogenase [Spirochaetia bacterium]|nr:dihydroorotate dehydrogenase [Spirochaetia bacterium]